MLAEKWPFTTPELISDLFKNKITFVSYENRF